MKIKVLGSYGSEGQGQRPSALLVDDRVLVDAGTVGGALSAAEQVDIECALISHAHLHLLLRHVVTNITWPTSTSTPNPKKPVLTFRPLAEEGEARVAELWVTPIQV